MESIERFRPSFPLLLFVLVHIAEGCGTDGGGQVGSAEGGQVEDPSGRVIATGSTSIGGMMFQCASDGAPVNCADVAQCELGSVWASAGCQPDGCP
jgi:hypothetical protein